MKYLFIPFILLLLSGCLFDSNKKISLLQTEGITNDIKTVSSGNNNWSEPLSQPMTVTFGSNSIINAPIIIGRQEPSPTKSVKIAETVEQKLKNEQNISVKEEKSVFNPFTYLLIGSGILLLIVCFLIIRSIWNNSMLGQSINGGLRSLNSCVSFVSEKRKSNLDPIRDQIYKEVEEDLLRKLNALKDKK